MVSIYPKHLTTQRLRRPVKACCVRDSTVKARKAILKEMAYSTWHWLVTGILYILQAINQLGNNSPALVWVQLQITPSRQKINVCQVFWGKHPAKEGPGGAWASTQSCAVSHSLSWINLRCACCRFYSQCIFTTQQLSVHSLITNKR